MTRAGMIQGVLLRLRITTVDVPITRSIDLACLIITKSRLTSHVIWLVLCAQCLAALKRTELTHYVACIACAVSLQLPAHVPQPTMRGWMRTQNYACAATETDPTQLNPTQRNSTHTSCGLHCVCDVSAATCTCATANHAWLDPHSECGWCCN